MPPPSRPPGQSEVVPDEEPASGDRAAPLPPPPPAAELQREAETPKLVGRLRRWNPQGLWGFIFSGVHNCDIYYDGEEDDAAEGTDGGSALVEGDFVLFELKIDEEGSPAAFNAQKAKPQDLDQLQASQLPVQQPYSGTLQDVGTCPAGHWLEAKAFGWRVTCDACRRPNLPHASMLVCHQCHFARCQNCSDTSRDGNPPTGVSMSAPRALPPHLEGLPGPPPPPSRHAAGIVPPAGEFLRAEASYSGRQTAGTRGPGGGFLNGYDYRGAQGLGEASTANNRRPAPITGRSFDVQGASARLLLEAPPMLERNFPRAVVSALNTGDRSALRRGHTFPANRSGAAMQIGWEFGRVLRETRDAMGQHEEPEAAAARGYWWNWYSSQQGGGGGPGGAYGDNSGMPNAALCA